MLRRPSAELDAKLDASAPKPEATDQTGLAPPKSLQRLLEPLQKRARGLIDDHGAVEKIVERAEGRVDRHRELSTALAPLRRLTVSYARGTYRDVPAADVALALSAQLYVISPSAPGLKDDEWVVRLVTERIDTSLQDYARWAASIGSQDSETAPAAPTQPLTPHALPTLAVATLDPLDTSLLSRVDIPPPHNAPPIALKGAVLAALGIDAALKAGHAVQILGPDDIIKGLGLKTLEMVPSSGGNLGVVRDAASKRFSGHLRFGDVGEGASRAEALAAFQVASAITLQYYLARIDRQLGEIQAGVGALLQIENDNRHGTIETARARCQTVERALVASGTIGAQDATLLNHASHDLEQVYASLVKVTGDFCSRVESADFETMKKDQISELLKAGATDFVTHLELLVITAVVRHRIHGVQTHLYAADGEARVGLALEDNANREQIALQHLERCRRGAAKLNMKKQFIDERAGLGGLESDLVEYSRAIAPTFERLTTSQDELPRYVSDTPFILEMQLGPDGEMQMQWAELTCSPTA